jgi:serine/threonine protein kinase
MTKRTWETTWERVASLAAGGQGTTSIVRRRAAAEQTKYVLKTLNRPRDPERRARMMREIEALRTLGPEGIPVIVDCSDPDAPLPYIVTEYVDGCTLAEAVREHPLDAESALEMAVVLLETLARCHAVSIVHRDIKPDNILLRGGDPDSPCLLDFGLCAWEDDDDHLTGSEQQVGNRFLLLPEYATPDGDKRDPRSDLTACIGLLLFALTARQPMTLVDHEGLKPHERSVEKERLASVPAPTRLQLARFLDRAFEPRMSERWQTNEEVVACIRAIRDHAGAHQRFCAALPPSDPDSWTDVLVWTSDPTPWTFWIRREGRQFTIEASRRGAFFSGGDRLWMWEQLSVPTALSNQEVAWRMQTEGRDFDEIRRMPKIAAHVDSARLIDLDSGIAAPIFEDKQLDGATLSARSLLRPRRCC